MDEKEFIVTDGMDEACINLCIALNKLPGVSTYDSCCGHGKGPYRIYMHIDSNSLGGMVLARCMSGRYHNYAKGESRWDPEWHIRFADTEREVAFLLEGKTMGESKLHEPAEKLARNIKYYIDEDFLMFKEKDSHDS